MKAVLFFILLTLSIPLFAQQGENPNRGNPVGFLPSFAFDAFSYQSTEPGKTRVDLYVEVPFVVIQFVKSPQGFTASYNITASFFNEGKDKLLNEKTWTETVTTQDFDATTSKKNYNLSLKSFNLAPTNYFVRIQVEDKDSKKTVARESKFTVRDIGAFKVGLSDVLLIEKEMLVNGTKKMVPNISKNVAARKEGLSTYYEIYSDTAKTLNVTYTINDNKNKGIFAKDVQIQVNKGTTPVSYTLDNSELNMGEYALIVSLKDENGKLLSETAKKFFSRWVGVPSSIADLDKAVDEMVYIAKESELDNIKDAPTKEEKLKRFMAFWKTKDPTPNTEENEVFEEYYRRIAFANEHFKNYLEGWRSDMGMVFITLGPPSNIERYPYEIDSKPYEVWDYYDINKEFVFVDQTGFGDYRLQNPVYGSWWKYRQ